MANQAVRLWEGMLQCLPEVASTGILSRSTSDMLRQLGRMPPQPKATWNRLVLDMQVRGSGTRPACAP